MTSIAAVLALLCAASTSNAAPKSYKPFGKEGATVTIVADDGINLVAVNKQALPTNSKGKIKFDRVDIPSGTYTLELSGEAFSRGTSGQPCIFTRPFTNKGDFFESKLFRDSPRQAALTIFAKSEVRYRVSSLSFRFEEDEYCTPVVVEVKSDRIVAGNSYELIGYRVSEAREFLSASLRRDSDDTILDADEFEKRLRDADRSRLRHEFNAEYAKDHFNEGFSFYDEKNFVQSRYAFERACRLGLGAVSPCTWFGLALLEGVEPLVAGIQPTLGTIEYHAELAIKEIDAAIHMAELEKDLAENPLPLFDEVQFDPGPLSFAHYAKGLALLKLARFLSALAEFSSSIDLSPNWEAYRERARIQASLGNLEEAAEDLELAIDLEPEQVELWIMQTMVLNNLRQNADACYSARQACDLGQCNLEFRVCAGVQ